MTKYILDSNALISPYNDYYRQHLFPTFWDWYKNEITNPTGNIILPKCVYDELEAGGDDLAKWVKINLKSIVYDETKDGKVWLNYNKVISYVSKGYYKEASVDNWKQFGKADPLLIAIAMTMPGAKIVTFEKRSGNFMRNPNGEMVLKNIHNPIGKEPKIPDVADQFNIGCISLFDLEEELKIRL